MSLEGPPVAPPKAAGEAPEPVDGAALARAADHSLVVLEPALLALRRELHTRPEVGFDVGNTAGLLAGKLQDLGLPVRSGIGGAGVVADLKGAAPGHRVLVRAELDALPIPEESGLDFAATGSAAHLCGHDLHLAALFGVAAVLTGIRASLPGCVRFCLQPAEELLAGAAPMLADGVLDGVDCVLAAHVLSGLPFGTVAINSGPMLAGADFFRVMVSGAAGHAGTPRQLADAILASAHITTALQTLAVSGSLPGQLLVIAIGAVEGGYAANAAPESVTLLGNVRWFGAALGQEACRRVEDICTGVAGALGCRARVAWTGHAPALVNDPGLAALARGAIRELGECEVVGTQPLTASDDVAELFVRVPGLYLGIGCGGQGAAAHHHPRFEADERAVLLMARVLCRTLLGLVRQRANGAPGPIV